MNIIITGSGKGLGFEVLKHLAITGEHKILGISRHNENCQNWIDQAGMPNVSTLDFDLENTADYPSLYKKIQQQLPHLDILLNNAGYLKPQSFKGTTEHEFQRQLNINLKVPFFLTQALLPLFSNSSHIVNIGSMGGLQGSQKFKGIMAYSISKGAIANFTECLAEELKDKGIRVNCLALGAAQTEMLALAFPGFKAPLQAVEMAEYIAWFVVNGQKYFNGKLLPVAITTP